MEQIAQVRKLLDGDVAEVIRVSEHSCKGNCGTCGGCNDAKSFLANNSVGAQVSDRVVIRPDANSAKKLAFLLHFFPAALFLLGYLLGEHFWAKGPLCGIIGIALGIWLVVLLDKMLEKKHPITYTIIGYADKTA